MKKTDRYQVIDGSQTGHCCFEATVVDTNIPHLHFQGEFVQVCECLDRENAEYIAYILNAAEPKELNS